MVSTCSPHRPSGGTLLFPSPTHHHHLTNSTSAIRSIRRSLSRSPSKGGFGIAQKPHSVSPQSPLSPSLHSPPLCSASTESLPSTPSHTTQSPLAIPFPPSAKIQRNSIRRPHSVRASSKSRNPSNSPARRPLSQTSGNSYGVTPSPTSSRSSDSDKETKTGSPFERRKSPADSPARPSLDRDHSAAHRSALARLTQDFEGSANSVPSTSSPLKRSDGIMDLDQASQGSPVAKRRSLHGATFGSDLNIFEQHIMSLSQSRSLADGRSNDAEKPASSLSAAAAAASSSSPSRPQQYAPSSSSSSSSSFQLSMPKRSSSLRKSTLQQRHEKPTLARARPNTDLAFEFAAPAGAAAVRSQAPRMSFDAFVAPLPRDSPFAAQGSLPSASVHPTLIGAGSQAQHQRHPLSQAISQSSSSSSLVDDSPTHMHVSHAEHAHVPRTRPVVDFAKSLPVGASRFSGRDPSFLQHHPAAKNSSAETFTTPQSYKNVKPLPAAFMSTGLISKRNRIQDDQDSGESSSHAHMPDTPCKRPMASFEVTSPAAVVTRRGLVQNKEIKHRFGTPSTPFNPHLKTPGAATFGKGVNIFGSNVTRPKNPRRYSFVSVDSDDSVASPPSSSGGAAATKISTTTDAAFPPTPTKQIQQSTPDFSSPVEATKMSPAKRSIFGDAAVPTSVPSASFQATGAAQSGKCSQLDRNPGSVGHETHVEGGAAAASSDAGLSQSHTNASQPCTTGQEDAMSTLLGCSQTPSVPGATPTKRPPFVMSEKMRERNLTYLTPAKGSPHASAAQTSPHTPSENILPPDPSGLSISGHADGLLGAMAAGAVGSSGSMFPPATPTAPREHLGQSRNGVNGSTPFHGFTASEIDASLVKKFDKVELIGTGEFSQVFRVVESGKRMSSSSSSSSLSSPPSDRVFAVKRSRRSYAGAKDRSQKMQEVKVLRALGQADHILQFVDSWEDRNHLYIQTELCEEGGLDMFLQTVGRKARLDDFRIWKILLELTLGVRHIHDAGYIHLDLKPANVLITFEGILKIADFGMAAKWPAPRGIEAEGDRDYIGPEVLLGEFDKPSDIFALGLVMLEIAGNVVLPENGPSWQKLRAGDMSDVPSLSWSSESYAPRDSSGNPISAEASLEDMYVSDSGDDGFASPKFLGHQHAAAAGGDNKRSTLSQVTVLRHGELDEAPTFMKDPTHEDALDGLVRWMISPEPSQRPVADQILDTVGVKWAANRRRAGATVFEGNFGPDDRVLGSGAVEDDNADTDDDIAAPPEMDEEMTDI